MKGSKGLRGKRVHKGCSLRPLRLENSFILKGVGGGVPKADETVSQWEDEFEIWGFLLAISSTVGGALVCPASAL